MIWNTLKPVSGKRYSGTTYTPEQKQSITHQLISAKNNRSWQQPNYEAEPYDAPVEPNKLTAFSCDIKPAICSCYD
jgi:hypothetical protein